MLLVVVVTVVCRLIRGEIPREGASFDCDVLSVKWWCRGELFVSSRKFVFRCVNGADNDWSMTGCWEIGIDTAEWDEGELGWFVLISDVDDWAVVIDANLGRLKQARRIKWREFDFDERTIPGLESSARNKIYLFNFKDEFLRT